MNATLDSFFKLVSKYILVVPFLIILLGLIVRFGFKDSVLQKTPVKVIPTPTVGVQVNIFDLAGPLVCSGKIDQGTYNVYVVNSTGSATLQMKDKKIELRLFNNCIYYWTAGQIRGTKICGVSSYLSIMQSSPFIGQMLIKGLPGNLDMTKATNSCSKIMQSEGPLGVPDSIQFSEGKLPQ